MIKAIVFDMDGVLLDTERLSQVLLHKAFLEQGLALTDKCFEDMLGTNLETSRQIVLAAYPSVDCDLMIRRWNEIMQEHIQKEGIPLKKGVPQILYKLKSQGIKIGLATSTQRDMVEYYFEKAGFTGLFDAMVCGSEAPNGKPAPDIYLQCAKLMNTAPEDCAGVEDSLNGVKAVRAAGMLSIMVPDMIDYGPQHRPYVDKVLKDLTEL